MYYVRTRAPVRVFKTGTNLVVLWIPPLVLAVCVRLGGVGRGELRADAARAICGVESGVGYGGSGTKATGDGVAESVTEEAPPEVEAAAGETTRCRVKAPK